MNKNNFTLFNKIKRDSLIRTSDSPETMADYLVRYYKQELPPEQVVTLFKAVQTSNEKIKAARKAKALVEINN